MSEFKKMGYKPDDLFEVVVQGGSCEIGSLVKLYRDDLTCTPLFKVINGSSDFYCCDGEMGAYIHLGHLRKLSSGEVTPDTEITITATAEDWAEVRLWLGASTSRNKIYNKLIESLPDPHFPEVREFREKNGVVDFLNYDEVKERWLGLVFKDTAKPQNKKELEKQAKVLQEEVEKLRKQIDSM